MIGAIVSFLGGSAFRMIWGEVSHWITAAREHKREIERMRLQGDLDAAQHSRNLESIRVQAELGVKEIRVKSEAELDRVDAEGFYAAVTTAMKPSGIWLVDLWNGIIRPLCASIAIVLWVFYLQQKGWAMDSWSQEMVAAILGFFFADRSMGKRGK
jgi:hypothetical protein